MNSYFVEINGLYITTNSDTKQKIQDDRLDIS